MSCTTFELFFSAFCCWVVEISDCITVSEIMVKICVGVMFCIYLAEKYEAIMKDGKVICEELKAIRQRIADENGIEYSPVECNHEGNCSGTCPKCESEVRYLEGQLRRRRSLGRAVVLGGLAVGLSALSSCELAGIGQVNGYLEPDSAEIYTQADSIQIEAQADTVK